MIPMTKLTGGYMLLYALFTTSMYCCRAQAVTILMPPENATVCRDSNVTVSCGYDFSVPVSIDWIINGNAIRSSQLDNGTYMPNTSVPNATSLTILSINDTTTIQCSILLDPAVTSWVGTIAVIGLPTIEIIRVANECTYIYVLWMNNSNACGNVTYNLLITPDAFGMAMTTTMNFFNFTDLTPNTSYNIVIEGNNTAGTHFVNISRTTKALEDLVAPTNVTVDVSFEAFTFLLEISWQAGPIIRDDCTLTITNYSIIGLDQNVVVPANRLSVERRVNDTVAANRDYSVAVIALSGVVSSIPSERFEFHISVLQNCSAASPSSPNINISCNSSHQIQVTLTCINCTNPMVTVSGKSPLIVEGDPGVMYNVTINVFDGSQVVLQNLKKDIIVTVMIDIPDITDAPSSNTGAIIGGVIGGIVGAVIIVITTIIIVVYCFIHRNRDSTDGDKQVLKSPTATIQPSNQSSIPHQTTESGVEYAVTAKVNTTTKPLHQPTEEYAMVDKNKKHAAATQGIQYADLQPLPSSGDKPTGNQGPTATYAQVA